MDETAERMLPALTPGAKDSEADKEDVRKESASALSNEIARPAFEASRRSSSALSQDIPLITVTPPTDDSGSSDDGSVVESNVRLVPACIFSHGSIKAKDKDPILYGQEQAYSCGRYDECDRAMIVPVYVYEGKRKEKEQPPHRLMTSSAEADLKRWVLTPNDTLAGATEDRSLAFVQSPRYDTGMLIAALELAVREIQYEIPHVQSLKDYAARAPYRRHFRTKHEVNVKHYVDELAAFIRLEKVGGVDRVELELVLLAATKDLENLREKAARFCKTIMGLKMEEAKTGDTAEIGDLLRIAAVDAQWVEAKCSIG